jgi:hypothetical protein
MADVRRFPYKGRRIATFEAIDGTTIITYEADQTQIDRIEREYGQDFIYGNAVYIAQYNKGSRNLSAVPNGPAGDQNILNGISNVDLVAEINNDSTFYNQATGTAPPQPTEQNPDQLGGSSPINPAPIGTPQNPARTILFYPNDLGTTFNSDNQDVIAFETFDYKSGIDIRLSPGDAGKFGELKPVQFIKTDEPIIVLPIQSSITDQNSVGWESDTMNPIEVEAAELSETLMTTNSTLELIKAATGFYNTALIESKKSGNEIRTYLVGQAVGVNNLLSRLEGKVLNPNLELLFQGPQLRPFNFTFKMSPRNGDEAVTVKKIINFFKKNMAVRKEDSVVFLKAPRVFKIKYVYGATFQEHPGVNLIKMCALTNCSVDYTPLGSYATFRDGTMVAYNITLSFQELTPIYNTDYEKFDYGDGETISNHPIGA